VGVPVAPAEEAPGLATRDGIPVQPASTSSVVEWQAVGQRGQGRGASHGREQHTGAPNACQRGDCEVAAIGDTRAHAPATGYGGSSACPLDAPGLARYSPACHEGQRQQTDVQADQATPGPRRQPRRLTERSTTRAWRTARSFSFCPRAGCAHLENRTGTVASHRRACTPRASHPAFGPETFGSRSTLGGGRASGPGFDSRHCDALPRAEHARTLPTPTQRPEPELEGYRLISGMSRARIAPGSRSPQLSQEERLDPRRSHARRRATTAHEGGEDLSSTFATSRRGRPPSRSRSPGRPRSSTPPAATPSRWTTGSGWTAS
jgi:hypothetical protein